MKKSKNDDCRTCSRSDPDLRFRSCHGCRYQHFHTAHAPGIPVGRTGMLWKKKFRKLSIGMRRHRQPGTARFHATAPVIRTAQIRAAAMAMATAAAADRETATMAAVTAADRDFATVPAGCKIFPSKKNGRCAVFPAHLPLLYFHYPISIQKQIHSPSISQQDIQSAFFSLPSASVNATSSHTPRVVFSRPNISRKVSSVYVSTSFASSILHVSISATNPIFRRLSS